MHKPMAAAPGNRRDTPPQMTIRTRNAKPLVTETASNPRSRSADP